MRVLHLGGNNMTGGCVAALGDLLRASPGLARLHLEWNCVGGDQEAFAQLCSGLAASSSLELLDLRSRPRLRDICELFRRDEAGCHC